MSWNKKTVNGYLVAETDILPFKEAADIESPVITDELGGIKTALGIEITTAGTNQNTPLKVQYSFDAENWVDGDTVIANVDMSDDDVHVAEADLTDKYAPYYRLILEPASDVGDTGRVKFFYTARPRN